MLTLVTQNRKKITAYITVCVGREKWGLLGLFARPFALLAFASCLLALLHDDAEEERHKKRRASKEGQDQNAPNVERSPHYLPYTGRALW